MRYTYLAWHTVTETNQYVHPGMICVHWQTAPMRAPAFNYYETWEEAVSVYPGIIEVPEYRYTPDQ